MHNAHPRQRILIIDDEATNIKLLGGTLQDDYQVFFGTGGRAALELARRTPQPDLILLDIIMPDMDGYEVCRRLKQDPATRDIPVIFITAMSEEADETRGLEVGAVDYITKPFSKAIVRARVKTHLELKRHRDFLEQLSSLDGLTGIPNRRRFDEYLEIEWRRNRREATPLSLILCDIDNFKSYNDTYGHIAGDDCLKQVAHILLESLKRPSDLVARYGGEEFAVVLPDTDHHGGIHVADDIHRRIAARRIPHRNSETAPIVTVSVGAATALPRTGLSAADLIRASDQALYQAKFNGKNRVVADYLPEPPESDAGKTAAIPGRSPESRRS